MRSLLLNVRDRLKRLDCSCRVAAQFNKSLQATWDGVWKLAMKRVFIAVLSIALVGCVDRDQVDLARYNKTQLARYDRYDHGTIADAKQALHEIIADAQQNRGELKYFYGAEWEVCLCYGRLAIIAEHEGEQQSAQKYWDAAVEAQLQYQKDERAWARSNPGVRVPNQESDVYERVSPDAIRKFLAGLERDKQIAWKHENGK
jgi:hypothetical protein